MQKEITITVEMLGEEATVAMANRMAELIEERTGWVVSVGYPSAGTMFDDPDEQFEFDKLWQRCLKTLDSESIISLVEYATLHNKEISSVRQKALRGGFTSAKKIGRNWVIDRYEPYNDLRKKPE